MNIFYVYLPLVLLVALVFFDGYLPYRKSLRK
jgi:hypothetical protein